MGRDFEVSCAVSMSISLGGSVSHCEGHPAAQEARLKHTHGLPQFSTQNSIRHPNIFTAQ
eukprot:2177868-Amphidinium_carterae.1